MDTNIKDLLNLFDRAPTAWHAVDEIKAKLDAHSFTELQEGKQWDLTPGKAYYVVRNGSTLCAFVMPKGKPSHAHIVAAHTDSPALKIKPLGEHRKENMVMLDVEIYGGPLLNSWLNRDLGIAGRITYLDEKDSIKTTNITITDAPVVIPQLAIHLDREVNTKGLVLNKQTHLSAIAAIDYPEKPFLMSLIQEKVACKEVFGSDLFLYPLEAPRLIGANSELIASYRYDNLGSAHAALSGLLASGTPSEEALKIMVLWDNEEIGSSTPQGAASPFLSDVIERVLLKSGMGREDFLVFLNNSICLSVDQAHALHPSFPERHDPLHQPLLGQGIVIKYNAQQRYATDAYGEAFIKKLCVKNEIPYQSFVSRGDIPCGSTIGPIHAATTGVKTIDVGCPQLSMHSARELASCKDHLMMCRLTRAFYTQSDS